MCPADDVREYLTELTATVRAGLGDDLVGVYTTGSVALNDYLPGSSDIDVAAVAADTTPRALRRDLAERVQHAALPCPARGLELVVHTQSSAARGLGDAAYLLEVNTGAELRPLVRLDPAGRPRHWFVIDRMVARQSGHALAGPLASEVFAAVPRQEMLRVVAESVADQAEHLDHAATASAALNACRALCFAAQDRWLGKQAAGEWALRHGALNNAAVQQALDQRRNGSNTTVNIERSRRLLTGAHRRLVDETG